MIAYEGWSIIQKEYNNYIWIFDEYERTVSCISAYRMLTEEELCQFLDIAVNEHKKNLPAAEINERFRKRFNEIKIGHKLIIGNIHDTTGYGVADISSFINCKKRIPWKFWNKLHECGFTEMEIVELKFLYEKVHVSEK